MTAASTPQKLDMNAVWARAMVLLRENKQLIGLLAGVFILLPAAFLNFAIPPQSVLEGPMTVLLDPASAETAKRRALEALSQAIGPLLVAAGVVQVIQHVGYAAMMALVGRHRPTVGGALVRALKAVLPIMIALIVYLIGMYALLTIVTLVLTPFGQAVAGFLGGMLGLLAMLFVTARLSLTMPVIVVEGELNPFKALLRAWRITAASPGNVFGFWMLLIVAYFVIFILVSGVGGLIGAIAGSGAGATLITGLIGGVFGAISGMVICVVAVAMHAQLIGPSPSEVASDFD